MFKLNKNEKNNTIRRPFTSIANIYVYYSISDETSNMLRCLKIALRNFASELSFSRKKKKKKRSLELDYERRNILPDSASFD